MQRTTYHFSRGTSPLYLDWKADGRAAFLDLKPYPADFSIALQQQNRSGATNVTAGEIKKLLHLEPHPREGGWFIQTWKSEELIPAAALWSRYTGARSTSSAIYYLLEPDSFSEMHKLESDEVFHFYLGDPVEMLQLVPEGEARTLTLGRDVAAGMSLQTVVPRGVWQGSRLMAGGKFALLGCTVSPGFDYDDYTTGSRSELMKDYPHASSLIAALTRM